jgi:hypothetical protein
MIAGRWTGMLKANLTAVDALTRLMHSVDSPKLQAAPTHGVVAVLSQLDAIPCRRMLKSQPGKTDPLSNSVTQT